MTDPSLDPLLAVSRHLQHETTVGQVLTSICYAAQQALPQTAYVGVTMCRDDRIETLACTDHDLAAIDQVQYETQEGPCIDTLRYQQPVVVSSTLRRGPWPEFREVAAQHGVKSTLGLPMVAGDTIRAALNLFSRTEQAYDAHDISVGQVFATQAAYVAANAMAYREALALNEHLTVALESRATIEQAKGILMGTTGCNADQAFERLRDQSQHENVKLRDIAAEIVRQAQRE